jgi:hypothetical protein
MDVRVAFYAVEIVFGMVYTSHVFLCFLLMAGATMHLRRYVDFLRMLFQIDNIDVTAATSIGTMDGVCIFHPVYGASVAFQAIG